MNQNIFIVIYYTMATGLRNLCTPASVYLALSMFAIIVMFLQNYQYSNTYCLGNYSCYVTDTFLIFAIKILYVLFWTWILNLICGSGATNVAWFLVLLPFILMFVLIGAMVIS